MRPPLGKLLPELQRQSREACEQFAAAEFKPDVVRMRIFEAAKKGHTVLRLTLPHHLDLRATNAARALAEWCKESELTLEWLSREVDTGDSRRATVWEPEISWPAKS